MSDLQRNSVRNARLIVAPAWVGDAVMSLGLLQLLKKQAPEKPLHVLCSKAVSAVYRHTSVVDEVIEAPFAHGGLQWAERRAVAKTLRQKALYLEAWVLPNSLKSALVPFWAGIPMRIGYAAEARSVLLHHAPPKPAKHNKPPMLHWYARLAGLPDALVQTPRMQVSDAQRAAVLAQFDLTPRLTVGHSAPAQTTEGFLAFAPAAEFGPAKRWPTAHFAQLAQEALAKGLFARVVILGGPKDVDIANDIRAQIPVGLQDRVVVAAGRTSLDEAIALISAAAHLVTNDSGLMHVAAATGVPMQALFGSSDPRHTPPLSDRATVHWLHLECSPCFQRVCPLGHTRCLGGISAGQVLSQLQSDHEH